MWVQTILAGYTSDPLVGNTNSESTSQEINLVEFCK